jgi:Leucine-rich repeat (LRR) protein
LTLDQNDKKVIDLSSRSHIEGKTDNDVKHLFLKFKPVTVQKVPNVNLLFDKFKSLEVVELWKTSMKNFQNINNCAKLKVIDLRLNRLQTLSKETFMKCTKLKKLILAKNEIVEVHEKAFENLIDLKFLDLSANLITFLSDEIFTKLVRLEIANLSHNKLTDKSLDFLLTFDSLKILNLSFNEISIVDFGKIASHSELREIHLNGNRIITIYFTIEEMLPSLVHFNLEKNNLRVLGLSQIATDNLQYLDISHNQINSLSLNVKKLGKLTNFHAADNVCVDESFEEIKDFEKEVSDKIQNCIKSK